MIWHNPRTLKWSFKNSKNQAYATEKSHVTSNLIITDGPNIYLIVQPHFCHLSAYTFVKMTSLTSQSTWHVTCLGWFQWLLLHFCNIVLHDFFHSDWGVQFLRKIYIFFKKKFFENFVKIWKIFDPKLVIFEPNLITYSSRSE